ncbi:cell division protein FtsZ [Helicobacter sp. 23-1046]
MGMDEVKVREIDETEYRDFLGARIAAIGVGGGGSNMINHLAKKEELPEEIALIAANTDMQHLSKNRAREKIQLGKKLTKGLGAGADPQKGLAAAEESATEIAEVLRGYDMVFISTGLGGGTGTGASPIIADIVNKNDTLTVAIVTKPFDFEGDRRKKVAEEGLRELKSRVHCIIVIPNQRVMSILGTDASKRQAEEKVNDVLANAVLGISNIVLGGNGENDQNVDFADIRAAMENKGLAMMSIGEGYGSNAAMDAIKKAIDSEMLSHENLKGAQGIIACFEAHPDYSMSQLNEACELINALGTENTFMKIGNYWKEDFEKDYVRVTFLATGFENEVALSTVDKESVKNLPMTDESFVAYPTRVANGEIIMYDKSNGRVFDRDGFDEPTYIRNKQD